MFARKREAELTICKSVLFHNSPWFAKAILRPNSFRSFAKASATCLMSLGEFSNGYPFDIVQAEELKLVIPAFVLSRKAQSPLVLDEPDVEFDKARQWASWGNSQKVLLTERLFCRSARQVLTSSLREKRIMQHAFGLPDSRISVIPNGVDTTRFSPGHETDLRSKIGLSGRPVVLFMGNFGYFPNVDALTLIVEELVPRVREVIQDVAFLVIGKGLDSTGAPPTYNFRPLGFVEDPRAYIDMAELCIAPLRFGGGTRTKILEYMSMGKAVISTSKGCEGLEVAHGNDILIEDEIGAFAGAIVSLLRNQDLARRVGNKARQTVMLHYEWLKIANQLVSVYGQILND